MSALAHPQTIALDLAHQLAFRRGLGNSLYASPNSPVTASDVKSFAQQAFNKSNIAVLGAGISTDELAKAVQSSFGGSSSSSANTLQGGSSTYYGGEQRVPLDAHAGPLAQPTLLIAYGTSSAPTPEQKVLQQLLGGESNVKWTAGSSALAQAAAKVPGAQAKSFLLPYSDASLFGVAVTAPTSEAVAAVAKDVAAALKGAAKASGDEIKRAIAKAKFADAVSREQQLGLITRAGPAVSLPKASSNLFIPHKLNHLTALLWRPLRPRLVLRLSRKGLGRLGRQGRH